MRQTWHLVPAIWMDRLIWCASSTRLQCAEYEYLHKDTVPKAIQS